MILVPGVEVSDTRNDAIKTKAAKQDILCKRSIGTRTRNEPPEILSRMSLGIGSVALGSLLIPDLLKAARKKL